MTKHSSTKQPTFTRRNILALGAGAALVGGFPAPAIAQRFKRIRLASAWSRNLPFFFDIAQQFADQVTLASDGRIRVEHFASNELVGPRDLLAATGEGAVDAYHAFDYFWADQDTSAHLFSSVPFGLTLAEHRLWLAHDGQAHWADWGQRHGVVPHMLGAFGEHSGLWLSQRGLEAAGATEANGFEIQQLEGVNVRASGFSRSVIEKLGGQVQQMPLTALADNLGIGTLDAVSGISPAVDRWLGLDEKAVALAGPGVLQPMQTMTLGFNAKTWVDFSESDRALINAVASTLNTEFVTRQQVADMEARAVWTNADGLKQASFGLDLMMAASQTANLTLAEMADTNPETGVILDSQMVFRDLLASSGAIDTDAYRQTRARVNPARYGALDAEERQRREAAKAEEAEQAKAEAEAAAARQAEEQAAKRAADEAARRAEEQAAGQARQRAAELARQRAAELARQQAQQQAQQQAIEAQREAQLLAQRQAEELARQQAWLAEQQAIQAQQILQQQQILVPNVSDQGIAGGLDSPY